MNDLDRRLANLTPAKRELLARRMRERLAAATAHAGAQPPAIRRRAGADEHAPAPVSFAQQRLWLADQLTPGATTYHIATAVRARGPLDPEALGRGLNEVVRRHEALRTTFALVDEEPFQLIAPALTLELPLEDFTAFDESEREARARAAGYAESQRPFDLGRGPLLRARLLRLGEEEHVLQLTMHHIVSDGWSMGVVVRELTTLYDAYARGEESPLPELPIQYADYAVWQREWLQGEVLAGQLDYWRRTLANAPEPVTLPTDRPRPAEPTNRGETLQFALPPELSDAVAELCRREGVTPFMALLAAFLVLLQRYTDEEDLVVGSNIANRNRDDIEGLIGFFVNNIVLRVSLADDPTFRELLGRVRDASLGAYAHQDVPFERVAEEVQRGRQPSPLFQVMFVLQNAPAEELKAAGLTLTPFAVENPTAKFDLTLFMGEAGGRLAGLLEYNTDLYERATAERFCEQLTTLLGEIVSDPSAPVGGYSLMTESEKYALMSSFNE